MHPDMQFLVDARDRAGTPGTDVTGYRRFWNAYAAATGAPPPGDMHIHDRTVGTVPVRVYRPGGTPGPRPGIVYMHGGGFMLGDLDSSDTNAWGIAQETGAVVLSVDYRLAPEHPYPAAFEDCWAVLTWLARDGAALGVDPTRLAVAGDSAGGNMAAVLALAARDRGGPSLRAQALVYPWLGLPFTSASYRDNAEGPGLTLARMVMFRQAYLGAEETDDPYAMPLVATDLTGLPPAHVHTAELDPIRDDGRAYAARLAAAGVAVTYREAKGMIHGFLRARLVGAAARAEFEALCRFLRESFAEGDLATR